MNKSKTNRSGRHAGQAFTILVLLCLATLNVMAAEHHGFIRFGGLPIPGATVTASQGEKKFVTITGPHGDYSFSDLPDGTWTIRVEMLCFATASQELKIDSSAAPAEWELKLLPLSEMKAETKPVTSMVPAVLPILPAAGARGKSVADPSVAGTAPQAGFQRAQLNAAANAPAAASPAGGVFSGQSAEDLAQRASDGFLINGSSNNSASSPFGLLPAFGNVRKGPGSLYNGNIGLVLDNSALDARSYSFTGQNTPRPAYNRFTGTAAFGGPLKIPRLVKNGPVFTVNYQWTRNRNAVTQSGLMPTELERDGNFSQSLNAFGQPVRIFDPKTGAQFTGNTVPKDRISPQAVALLDLYPLPNYKGSSSYNYQIPVVGVTHQDSVQARANKTFRRMDQISAAFDFQRVRTDNPNLFGFLDKGDTTGLSTNLNWRHSFTLRFVSSLGYQYSRLASGNTPFFQNRRNVSGEAGISGNAQDPSNWGPPDLVFAGGTSTLFDGRPSFNRNQTNALIYSIFWGRGRHSITMGSEFRRQQFNFLSQQDPRGTYTFTGSETQALNGGIAMTGTGSDLADFILGLPTTSSIAFGNADKYFRASTYAAYVTDDFRVSPGVTVNAGLRWEYGSPITERYGRLVNLDIAPGFAAIVPVVASHPAGAITGQDYPSSLLRPDRRGIQPRLGLAWRPLPASSLVIRAGYGVYFNTSVYNTIAVQMAQQPPLSKTFSVQNSPDRPFTMANGFNGVPAGAANTFAVDPDFRVGYVQTWQLSIQRDLPAALVMIATYLGSKGTRGVQQFLPNTWPAGAVNPCPTCPAGYIYMTSNGNSTRESGQIQLRRRLQNGFTANVQYTFSKSIDDAALGGRGQGNAVIAQDWLNLRAERGLSSFDQRHQISLQTQYTTGMGLRGGMLIGGWKGRLLKEWTVIAQLTAGSGFPLTPVYLTAVRGTGVTGTLRPDYTGASVYLSPLGLNLNPAAFAAPASGHWGNAGRNSITGPAQFSVNASLGRTFRVGDKLSLDLRVDSMNVLNNVTFPGWNTILTSSQFGLPTIANPMRNVQTTLRARF